MSEKLSPDEELISFSDFLESNPPGNFLKIENLAEKRTATSNIRVSYFYILNQPELQLHCDNEHCGGTRFFRCENITESRVNSSAFTNTFLTYKCDNCKKSYKEYAIVVKLFKDSISGEVFKFGEYPTFGPPIPSKVISLIGPDREAFLKGRRAENQGLGIGAFSYYRRVIENQKSRIIDEIIKVATRIGAKKEMLDNLKKAKSETQFSKSIEMIKDGIPESLLISGGHNPLTLLHSALSEGLHAESDEDCLEFASSIRIVLSDLAEKLSRALKDDKKLKDAVSKLLNKNQS